jgi:hypothetical protein
MAVKKQEQTQQTKQTQQSAKKGFWKTLGGWIAKPFTATWDVLPKSVKSFVAAAASKVAKAGKDIWNNLEVLALSVAASLGIEVLLTQLLGKIAIPPVVTSTLAAAGISLPIAIIAVSGMIVLAGISLWIWRNRRRIAKQKAQRAQERAMKDKVVEGDFVATATA